MGRLLGLITLAVLLWLALQAAVKRLGAAAARGSFQPPAPKPPPEPLVRCAACGVHVPRSRAAVGEGGRGDLYCSETCRRRGAEVPPPLDGGQ